MMVLLLAGCGGSGAPEGSTKIGNHFYAVPPVQFHGQTLDCLYYGEKILGRDGHGHYVSGIWCERQDGSH